MAVSVVASALLALGALLLPWVFDLMGWRKKA
jgi:hypothetical protein